jgi:uncharacterized FlgJ-related protein
VSADILPHLKELYENSSKELRDEEKLQLKALLMHYKNAISKDKKDIGTTDMIEHCIWSRR